MAIDRTALVEQLEVDAASLLRLRRRCLEALEAGNGKIPYLRTILNATESALDRIIGKPTQPTRHEGEVTHRVVWEEPGDSDPVPTDGP